MRVYTTAEITFRNRPTDESVYCYPHRYRIEVRETNHGWEQRHIWIWDSGNKEVDAWIRSINCSLPGMLEGFTEIEAAH